jgi:hypothetical protein
MASKMMSRFALSNEMLKLLTTPGGVAVTALHPVPAELASQADFAFSLFIRSTKRVNR